MKRFYKILLFLLLFLVNIATVVVADTKCSGYIPLIHPDHYCDCKNDFARLYSLPLDVMVTDSMWFKTSSGVFTSGFTAYLYSDCDVQFDIYQNCTSSKVLYSVTIPKGQARDVSAESIKNKLESMGVGGASMAIYLCIYPVDGEGGRLMCLPYNTGYNSTCNDILELLPGMTFVSSHAETVYEITAKNISESCEMYLKWSEEGGASCDVEITRGNCNGDVVATHTFAAKKTTYNLDHELLMDVKAKGESLFAHFSHDAAAVGRIILRGVEYVDVLTDTVICRGKEFRYGDYVTTESGIYRYDTVKVSSVEYRVYGYNVVVDEPEVQFDTLAIRNGQLPYDYRGMVIDGFGDYDLMIETAGECSEHVMVNVKHDLTIIESKIDTSMCYGAVFEYKGENYANDVVIVDSVWSESKDTLYLNAIDVYFSKTPNVQYDTLAVTKSKVTAGFRYQGIAITAFKDYKKTMLDEHNCPVEYNLHVCHKVTNVVETVNTTLCDGDVYVHTNGVEYRTEVAIVDSGWIDDDTYLVKTTNVMFTVIELSYDTLMLRYSDLPYDYKGEATISEMADTTVEILMGKCYGSVMLNVIHLTDTVAAEQDTTLCQGKAYEHGGEIYYEAVVLVDSAWANRDTMVVTTTRVHFAAPEVAYDTIAIRAAELPYNYRGEEIADFGEHDLMIKMAGECDEHVMLYVNHWTTTLAVEQDTTLCQGKAYEHGGVAYYEAVVLVDSVWANRDTMVVTTTRVYFAAPEVAHDTIAIRAAELPYSYRGEVIADFGEYDLMIKAEGECDEHIMLYVNHWTTTLAVEQDTTLCQGKAYEHGGVAYYEAVVLVDSVWANRDTMVVTTTRVYFAAPEVAHDTIAIRAAELPYSYRGEVIADFGEYDLMIKTAGECDERIMLYVNHLTTTLAAEQDTTLCQGKAYEHNGEIYYEAVELVDSVWANRDTMVVTTTRVYFTAPEMEYDTVVVEAAELAEGYYYAIADEYVYEAGEYEYEIEEEGECTRLISLAVEEIVPDSIDDVVVESEPKLIMIDGILYIHHNGEYYTLTGQKIIIK